jgi:hypothetical protein
LYERSSGEHSPALLEAQRQLVFLRARHLAGGECSEKPAGETPPKQPPHPFLEKPSLPLPKHLGWVSARLTTALSISRENSERVRSSAEPVNLSDGKAPLTTRKCPGDRSEIFPRDRRVKVYPDIALGMLREEQVAAGRIWLLLRYMDSSGKGWISISAARESLARKNAGLRVCGWRQLRKLLARGEGLFWHRASGRIWLRSTSRVAASLGVVRLFGNPVAMPLDAILQGISFARAHLFATFHSSRSPKSAGVPAGKPISRSTLRELSHISRQTQSLYERRARVRCSSNFAVGGHYNTVNRQNSAWRHGRATFRFRDETGRLGRKGAEYTAWQLPNSYVGPHERRPKGQQKRINRELADLFMKGITGNGKDSKGAEQLASCRFFDKATTAAASYNLSPGQELYWPSQFGRPNRYRIWHCLAGSK